MEDNNCYVIVIGEEVFIDCIAMVIVEPDRTTFRTVRELFKKYGKLVVPFVFKIHQAKPLAEYVKTFEPSARIVDVEKFPEFAALIVERTVN